MAWLSTAQYIASYSCSKYCKRRMVMMGFSKLIGLIAVIGFASAHPNGFQPNNYPQNQVNAWQQACRNFQQQQLHTQIAQNQFFAQTFPQIGLPPLPFMDICGQFGGGGFAQSGASAGASSFSGGVDGGLGNRFGGSGGGGGGVHGVSVSSGSLPNGQSGTSVTHFGPGGASTTHYGQGSGGGFSTDNRFGGGNDGGNHAGASFSSFSSSPGNGGYATANRFGGSSGGSGVGVSSFGASSTSGNGGYATANRFGGNGGSGYSGVGASSYGGNGGSFATASRFGGSDGGQTYSTHGQHGAGISVSSVNDGHGNVHTQVHKQQY
ncbi:keratin, type I cytoskeletal 9 [Aedes aegypti]|uniref:Uncharacterized protein n=2 Tax=Aedes aegypti TaxID=7159 RepID=A0A1S4FIG4_AEDAE|nr:keratin, type I cytoskeletal 9 [Aedes aegypti]